MIRVLQEYEIPAALALAREVYGQYVASGNTEEGNAEFEKSLDEQQVLMEIRTRQLVLWGDFEQNYLVGMCGMTTYGYIRYFFVHSQWQNHGVGKQLLAAMYQYAFEQLHTADLSIRASVHSVGVLQRMGFQAAGQEQVLNGVHFVPMSMLRKSSRAAWLIPVCIGGGVLVFALVFLCVLFARKVQKSTVTTYNRDGYYSEDGESGLYGDDGEEYYYYGDEDGSEYYGDDTTPYYYGDDSEEDDPYYGDDSDLYGSDDTYGADYVEHSLDQIPVYTSDSLHYTVTKENKSLAEDQGSQSLDFDLDYPVISGMENQEVQGKVNQMLYEQAIYMMDYMYTNPPQEVQDFMDEQSDYMGGLQLMSDVEYCVAYADDDFMSVVFEDHYFLGSVYTEFEDIRTLNINMEDGSTYDIADIVNVNDDFMTAWMTSAQGEAPDSILFEKLTQEDFKEILDGSKNNFQYGRAFFVDADGLEIGFSYHYGDDNNILRGWLTAPFSVEELASYKTDSDFWTRIYAEG